MRLAGRAARKDATSRNHVVAVQRKASARLSRRDWILAGQEILREHGVSGVKLALGSRLLDTYQDAVPTRILRSRGVEASQQIRGPPSSCA